MDNIVINDALWLNTPNGCIGMILCTDTITNEPKVYVGKGRGHDESADAIFIKEFGCKLTKAAANMLKEHMDKGK